MNSTTVNSSTCSNQTKDLSSTLDEFDFFNLSKRPADSALANSMNSSTNDLPTKQTNGGSKNPPIKLTLNLSIKNQSKNQTKNQSKNQTKDQSKNQTKNLSTNQSSSQLSTSQSKQTNRDLINLDAFSRSDEKEDRYSIFKEIALEQDDLILNCKKDALTSDDQSEDFIFNNEKDDRSKNSVSLLDDKDDLLFGTKGDSLDLNDDFGEFVSSRQDAGHQSKQQQRIIDNSSLFSPNWISEDSEEFRIKRFEKLLNAILSILHKSFNVMMVSYDEKSVIRALSTTKGNNFVSGK